MTNTVHGLRLTNHQVKIRHYREFLGVHKVGVQDNYMTRGEYENARENGELEYDDHMSSVFFAKQYNVARGNMPAYGKAVDSFGGWTYVEVTTPDGRVLTGKHSFNNRNFCKKTGLRIALEKALGSDKHASRQSKKMCCMR